MQNAEIEKAVKSVGKTFSAKGFIALMSKFEVMVEKMKSVADTHRVGGPESEAKSVAYGTEAKKLNKMIDKARMSAKRPYLDFINQLDSYVRPVQKVLKSIEDGEKKKCVKYRNEVLRKQREKEAELAKAQAEKPKKLGKLFVVPTVEKPIRQAEGKVDTISGSSASYRTTPVPHLADIKKVPEEYLLVDWVKVRAAIKSGVTSIPGIDIKEEIDARFIS